MRFLHIKGGVVVNVVEYPSTPPEAVDGADIVSAVTGQESIGDLFDVSDTLRERRISVVDQFIFKELFRLTNGIRALQTPPSAQLTAAQYKAFIKTLI